VTRYVAFLRAINVGGRALVKMTDLKATFERAGGRHVSTLIQSGNVLFEAPARDAPAVVERARSMFQRMLGNSPEIMLRSVSEIERLIEGAPFGDLQPTTAVKLYVAFLSRKPRGVSPLPLISSSEALEVIGIDGCEAFIVSRPKRRGFFGFPNNFIEEQLGVPATTRNWSTVTKIVKQARPSGR
jgi:uncharacterized protein (DUF1697 family)